MATQHHPGGHWSAQNPIPTVQKLMQNLDKDKKDRDKQIDEEARRKKEQGKHHKPGEPVEEKKPSKGHARTVTDPVTGKEIQIEDVDKDFMKHVKNPEVRKTTRK
jgi:hypothetical protein